MCSLDSHLLPESQVVRQPRAPFSICAWLGATNLFFVVIVPPSPAPDHSDSQLLRPLHPTTAVLQHVGDI